MTDHILPIPCNYQTHNYNDVAILHTTDRFLQVDILYLPTASYIMYIHYKHSSINTVSSANVQSTTNG